LNEDSPGREDTEHGFSLPAASTTVSRNEQRSLERRNVYWSFADPLAAPRHVPEVVWNGIRVTTLHSHMLRETPRLFFMHFWGLDDPARIGEGLKAALAKVAVQ